MDIKTLLHNLREEVSCSVCSNIFTDPKQLPCLHSFCLNCLKQWQRTSHGQDTIRCPNCQALSRVPETGDLKDLPTSFYLNGMIDMLAIKECKTNQVRCGNCDERRSETSYCFQCYAFWCNECILAHDIIRGNRDHRVLALEDFQDEDYQEVLQRPEWCPKQGHKGEELKYFCKNCETAVCQACVIVDHAGHSMTLIEEEAEKQRIQMRALIETQTQKLQAKMNEVQILDDEFAQLKQRSEEAKKEVQVFVDNLIAVIEAKKRNLFKELEIQTNRSKENLTKRKASIEKQMTIIRSSLVKADKLLTRSSNSEVVQLKRSLATICENIDRAEPIVCDHENTPLRLVFENNQKMLDTINNEEIGFLEEPNRTKPSRCVVEGRGLKLGIAGRQAHFLLTTNNSRGERCYNARDHVTVEIKDKQGRECASEVHLDPDQDGTYKIGYFPQVPGRYEVTIMANGEHVHGSPFAVQVQPFKVQPVLSFGKHGSSAGMFVLPWGVAVNTKDEIAVTDFDCNRVQIFNSDGTYLRSFGRFGTNKGEFLRPTGIAFSKNGCILVADNNNNRIQTFTEMGEFVGSFGGKGSMDNQFSDPCGLSVDSDGNIIVADTGNKLIKIFAPDGTFLRKFGEQGSLSYPIHCVECDNNFVVSDMNDNCLKVFDRKGNFKYKFGQLFQPRCLSLTTAGHLVVCDTGNHMVKLFELNGTFVGDFGTKGNNLGEFDVPWSAAVLNNGRIVVLDRGNSNIQIFK